MSLLDWFTIGRIGLLYDLMGALILVWGYVLQGKKEFREAVAFGGAIEPIAPVTTKFDSIVGLSLLIAGFLAQLAGTDNCATVAFSACQVCVFGALITLVGIGAGYLLLRKVLFRRYILHLDKGGFNS